MANLLVSKAAISRRTDLYRVGKARVKRLFLREKGLKRSLGKVRTILDCTTRVQCDEVSTDERFNRVDY